MDKSWFLKNFDELTCRELYDLLSARNEVFVVGQNCNYLDTDGKDFQCLHLFCKIDNEIAAYCRIIPPGISYSGTSIGRVLTRDKFRNLGLGKELVNLAIESALNAFPGNNIKIGAQSYLLKFYSDFGFEVFGEEYLEDKIPHHKMILKKW